VNHPTNTYVFDGGSAINLDDLTFTEHAENEQRYQAASLSVNLTGSGDVTGCVAINDTTAGAGGALALDFSGCAATSLAGQTLTIIYTLTLTDEALAACNGTTFYSWSSLDLGYTGGQCVGDGTIHETTVVNVVSPAMSLSIAGLGQVFHKCEQKQITMTLTQTSNTADPKDVRLVLSGLNYYVVDPAATVCSGAVAPTSCTPALVGDDYVWYFADGFTGSGQDAVLQLQVQKWCTGSGDLVATAYFDDNCNDDATFDDTCSTTATETPALLLSGDLLIEKTPETYYAVTNQVQWEIYLTNRGTGTAYNVWVDDVLGSGLLYEHGVNPVVVDNMTGVTINDSLDHNGGAINGASVEITSMAAGERRQITFIARLIDCTNLTNDVTANWGCNSVDCQTDVTDNSIVNVSAPNLINTTTVTPAGGVNACSAISGTITLRNAGQITVYNLQVTETLPPNLLYVSGSTRWRLNGGGWNGPNVAYDPSPTVSPLVWTSTEIPGLATATPGDTIEIEFDMSADCPFAGGDITASTQYENPCADVFNTASSVFTVAFREPDINITKTIDDEPIGCNDAVQYIVTIINNSGYNLPVVYVEDTLGDAFTYNSHSWAAPYNGIGMQQTGQKLNWELTNLGNGSSAVLTLNATSDSPALVCSSDLDNMVQAWWGCGTVDGNAATKPDSEAGVCLSSTSVAETHTATRQPALSFLEVAVWPDNINTCNTNTEITAKIENTGSTDASNLDLVVTLPTGLSYNAGTSELCVGTDDSCITVGIGAPAIAGQALTYYNVGAKGGADDLAATLQASGGNDTLVLKFSVRSACYTTGDVGLNLRFYDCCGSDQHSVTSQKQIAGLYPDLAITKTPANATIACGNNQTWDIMVANNGTTQSQIVTIEDTLGNWIDYVSSNPPATFIGSTYTWELTNLAGDGASATVQITGKLNPDGLPNQADCTDSLRQNTARTRWGCGVGDGDPLTDNTTCDSSAWVNATAVELLMPDLVVDSITPTITCTADGTFGGSITVRVRNQGDGPTTGNFTVAVTDDGQGWSGSGDYTGDSIAANGFVNVTIDTTSWNPDCGDTYDIEATVDSEDDECECDETDNDFTDDSYTAPIPDLTVTGISFVTMDCANDDVSGEVRVTIENTGDGAASNFQVSLGTDGCFTFDNETVANLAASSSTVVQFNISGSWTDCTDGSCDFTATVDGPDAVCECDGTNNSLTETYTTVLPDLVVTDIDFSNLSCSGDSLAGTVDVTVQNQGYGSANNYQVTLTGNYLTFTPVTGAVALSNGQSTTLTLNVATAWSDPTACSSDFTATVDALNTICECDGSNNTRVETYNNPLPDLTVNSVADEVTCVSDGNLADTTVNVSNNGCVDASSVVLRLTSDCGLTFSDEYIDLAAGETKDIFFPFTSGITTCSCNFTAEIDPDNTICEYDGTDNTGASTSPMTIPDIEVQGDTLVVSCAGDGQGTVSGTVTLVNNGCGPDFTDNVPLRFTLSGNTGCSGNQVAQWTQISTGVSIPSAGGVQTFTIQSYNVVISPCVDSSNRQVSVLIEADCNDTICEWDGTDNILCTDKSLDVLIPVGGIMVPVSRLELLASWMGVIGLAGLAVLGVALARRRGG